MRTLAVTSKSVDGYQLALTRSGGSEPTKHSYSANIDEIVEDAAGSLVEHKTYEWPLTPGRKWKVQYTERSVSYPGRTYVYRFEARVEGPEVVTVPAGKFDTARIRVEGHYVRSNDQRSAEVGYTVWYSPKVKRAVKLERPRHRIDGVQGCGLRAPPIAQWTRASR